MKRILVALSAVAMVAVAAQAQAAKMYGGVKGGVTFANMSDIDDSSMRTGFVGGVFVGTHVNDQLGFRVEGLYVQKGAKADSANVDVTYKGDYIEFPILFVYDLTSSETMGFNLFAGPTLGFNVSAKVEDTDVKDNTESFEFGATIGAGLAKKMAGGKAITLDARYALGATGVGKDVPDNVDNPKNRGIDVMVGFQVPLGGQ